MDEKKIQLVEDLFYIFNATTKKEDQKEIVIILLTEYHNILNTYFSDKRKQENFKILEEQIQKNIIHTVVICGFTEEETPLYESRYILVDRENVTPEKKEHSKKRIQLFNDTLIFLNQAKIRNSSKYKNFKKKLLDTFQEELKQPSNLWIIEHFGLKKEVHKRARKND